MNLHLLKILFVIFLVTHFYVSLTFGTTSGEEGSFIKSKYGIELYGYLKLDLSYDTARINPGNFARWVESEEVNEDDNQFNLTANQTRLGLRFSGPDTKNVKTSGRLEIDFYGGGSENKAYLMMRHAFFQLAIESCHVSFLAGQTSDLFSPLNPYTVNYAVAWWAGNVGYRRPQVQLKKYFGDSFKIHIQGAIARSIGDQNEFGPGDTGEDAGYPSVQGRLALEFPLSSKKATVGFSGHWADEEYDIDETGESEDVCSWSANIDLSFPLGQNMEFKAEAWTGVNMDGYLGAIGQGINTETFKEIRGAGGWALLAFSLSNSVQFNIGGSLDDPDDEDLTSGQRSKNSSIWLNLLYSLNEAARTEWEVAYWNTDYIDIGSGDSIRIQGAFTYRF